MLICDSKSLLFIITALGKKTLYYILVRLLFHIYNLLANLDIPLTPFKNTFYVTWASDQTSGVSCGGQ